jgi:hypothetical protein
MKTVNVQNFLVQIHASSKLNKVEHLHQVFYVAEDPMQLQADFR